MKTVDDVCRLYPGKIHSLFAALDLDRRELVSVKQSFEKGDLPAACRELLTHYRAGTSGGWLRGTAPVATDKRDASADAILRDRFTFYEQEDTVPRDADGHLDWSHIGPSKDREWAWALNRHFCMGTLMDAYEATGNPVYVERLDADLRDWLTACPAYPAKRSNTPFWRGLEISFRVKAWARAFYSLMGDDRLCPATRLLLLAAIPDHAHYLRHFHAGGNWATMELSALAMAAAAWPEFKQGPEWLAYASDRLQKEIDAQVYPDGVQTELTSSYHRVALNNFEQFATVCRGANLEVPDAYARRTEAMWNYLAFALRPSGRNPLNSDSDLDDQREGIVGASKDYRRPDWLFIATNGREGVAPEGPPSAVFPWAGQLIARSGFDAGAHWGFFDFGPWGTGHQHNDMLHLSISAYGRDLLDDSGRFAYQGAIATEFRGYAVHSRAHNVVLIDGQGQGPGEKKAGAPLSGQHYSIRSDFDYARNTFQNFTGIEGVAQHTRALMYVRGAFWVVVDRIETDRPRRVEVPWHWHPGCAVARATDREGSLDVESTDPGLGNLRIQPAGAVPWTVEIVKGQKSPALQGWYSERYNEVAPAPASVYAAEIPGDATFAWVLIPGRGRIPALKIEFLPPGNAATEASDAATLRVEDSEGKRWTLNIPLSGAGEPSVRIGR